MVFLGRTISVHRSITDALTRLNVQITALAREDAGIRAFVASLGSIDAYNWRQIRGQNGMSYHSWGLAVDILPRQQNRPIYWLWEAVYNRNWMLVPPSGRWHPPEAFIHAFENEGFVWGGKWERYDTMHFEFRPELYELNRLLESRLPETRLLEANRKETEKKPPERTADLHHIAPLGIW
jgi:hypothetical protein